MLEDKNSKKIRRKIRRAYAVSTVSIALVLFILGAVGYFIVNILMASDRLMENMTMSVMLKDKIKSEDLETLKKNIEKYEGVEHIEFKSKEEAAKEFKEFIGNDFEEFLKENPIPASIEVQMDAKYSTSQHMKDAEQHFGRMTGVREVIYKGEIMDQISNNLRKFNFVMLIFGAVLLIISMVLIVNTIKITLVSKRFLINTMRLVGATRWFIERPMVIRAVTQGFGAWVIAAVMLAGMVAGLNEGLPEIGFTKTPEIMVMLFGCLLLLGVLISTLFTWIILRKMLKTNSKNIYYTKMSLNKEKRDQMILPAKNLKVMLVGVVVIIIGFLLMTGGGSDDPNVFNPEMFSFRRITLAPIVVLLGFGIIAFSIMKKFK
jgi:cell division transport system permease protein